MIDPHVLSHQLEADPAIPQDEVNVLVALAVGADAEIRQNPVFAHLLGYHMFATIAILYGSVRGLCERVIADEQADAETRAEAIRTLAQIDRLVVLTRTLPDKACCQPGGGLRGLGDVLREMGLDDPNDPVGTEPRL